MLTSITEDMQKLEPMCTVGRIVNGAVIMKSIMVVLQKKLKIGLLYDLAFPLLAMYPKELEAEF